MVLKKLVIKRKKEDEAIEIPEERLVDVEGDTNVYADNISAVIALRMGGKFKGKAFRLKGDLDWEIGIDELGVRCLVPLKERRRVDV